MKYLKKWNWKDFIKLTYFKKQKQKEDGYIVEEGENKNEKSCGIMIMVCQSYVFFLNNNNNISFVLSK